MRLRTPRHLLLLPLALALVACSEPVGEQADGAPTAPPEEGVVRFVGNDELLWEQPEKEVALPAGGELVLEVVCAGNVAHNVVVEGFQDEQVLVDCSGGRTGTAPVTIEPGEYYYWCAIPGHLAAGMDGTLTVTGG